MATDSIRLTLKFSFTSLMLCHFLTVNWSDSWTLLVDDLSRLSVLHNRWLRNIERLRYISLSALSLFGSADSFTCKEYPFLLASSPQILLAESYFMHAGQRFCRRTFHSHAGLQAQNVQSCFDSPLSGRYESFDGVCLISRWKLISWSRLAQIS